MAFREFIFKLFCPGEFSPAQLQSFQADTVEMLESNVPLSITFHNVQLPGMPLNNQQRSTAAALVLTNRRFLISSRCTPVLDVFTDQPRLTALELTLGQNETCSELTIQFNLEDFAPQGSGTVILKIKLFEADRLYAALKEKQKNLKFF